jgi:hypothetical protein
MVRVEFADREPVEYEDVTEITFTGAGGVALHTQPLTRFPNPQNLQEITTVPTGPPRLLGAWSKDSHWTHVVQTEDETAAEERPTLEVAR